MKEERLAEAFRAFDKDGSGTISMSEIKQVIGANDEEMKKIEENIKSFDYNNDGEIDAEEFVQMMAQMDFKEF